MEKNRLMTAVQLQTYLFTKSTQLTSPFWASFSFDTAHTAYYDSLFFFV